MNTIIFRKATLNDFQAIWNIISYAKEIRKQEGSSQWQDGYPNEQTILSDIEKNNGFVISSEDEIMAYIAIIFDIEPAYEAIEGKWTNQPPYAVIHRMAVSPQAKGKGLGYSLLKNAEELVKNKGISSIRIDTNFDNLAMLKILEKENYAYCGQVYFRGSARKAFEKILE